MALQLNSKREAYKAFPQEGSASNIEQMPKLISDKRLPLSIAGFMQARIGAVNAEADVKSAWMDSFFDTGDGIAYHPDGKIKIVPDSQHLRNLTAETSLRDGALPLEDGVYETLPGQEFTKKDSEKYFGDWLTLDKAKASPIWRALARDQNLLNAYVEVIFSEYQKRFANKEDVRNIKLMGAFINNTPKSPEMRAWCVGGLGYRSYANGRISLDDRDGRLVGLAPEALVSSKFLVPETRIVAPTLDQILSLGDAHVSPAGRDSYRKDVATLYTPK